MVAVLATLVTLGTVSIVGDKVGVKVRVWVADGVKVTVFITGWKGVAVKLPALSSGWKGVRVAVALSGVTGYFTYSLVTTGKYIRTAASPGESMHPISSKLLTTRINNNCLFMGRP